MRFRPLHRWRALVRQCRDRLAARERKHAVRSNVFALADAGLDSFLRGEVGTESNGSRLTILSALARLGFDPWAEAAAWARLPRAAAIDRVATLIAQMPLCAQSPDEARGTATRLALLLPGQAKE